MKTYPKTQQPEWMSIIGILGVLTIAILFNFFLDRIGYLQTATDPDSFKPLLVEGFRPHLVWLNLWCGLALTMHVINLVNGGWTLLTRWGELFVDFLAIFVQGRIVLGNQLFNSSFVDLAAKGVLVITAVGLIIGLIRKLTKLLIVRDTQVDPLPIPDNESV